MYFAYVFTALLLSSIMILIVVILRNFQEITLENIIVAFIFTAFVLPILIVILSLIDYYIRHHARKKLLNKLNFNLFESLECHSYPLNQSNKWQYTHLIPSVNINDFTLLIAYDLSPSNRLLKIIAMCDNNTINEERYLQLKNDFKMKNMAFDFGGVTLNLNPDNIQDSEVFKRQLHEFTTYIISEHFTPAKEPLL